VNRYLLGTIRRKVVTSAPTRGDTLGLVRTPSNLVESQALRWSVCTLRGQPYRAPFQLPDELPAQKASVTASSCVVTQSDAVVQSGRA